MLCLDKYDFKCKLFLEKDLNSTKIITCLYLLRYISAFSVVHFPRFISLLLSFSPSIHPSICPSILLSISPSIFQSVHPYVFPYVHQSIFPYVHQSIHPFFDLSCSPIHLIIIFSIHLGIKISREE